MHSSRMRTARLLTVSRSARGGGLPTSLEADPPGHVTCDACWEANPLCEQNDRHV